MCLIAPRCDGRRRLRTRGIGESAVTLAAQSGATVFGIAFAQWIREGGTRSLAEIASNVFHELPQLTRAATGSGSSDRISNAAP